MATTYLSRTFGTATSRFTCTASMWIKRSALGSAVFWSSYNSGNYRFQLYFDGSDRLSVLNVDNGVNNIDVKTTRKFRDTSGWYHLYFALKSSEATASDRVKIYVNGVRETAFDNATYQGTGNDMAWGAPSYTLNIGRYGGNSDYFSGSMSHSYFIDGSIVDVSEFGSTDANGVWKINTSPTISSYGNEGFLILKDGNSVTDQSGNSNNFTVAGGTLTNTEDNPSNVFATFNPLFNYNAQATFSNGNLQVSTSNSATNITPLVSTLGMSSGKYYAEIKYSATTDPGDFARIGVCSKVADRGTNVALENDVDDHAYQGSNGNYLNNTNSTSYGATYTTGDIIGVALDLDNGYIYFHKNGTYQNSGDPTSGATGTGGKSVSTGKDYFFAVADVDYLDSYTYQANFGNGYFGTTAVASAGTNASGIGIFEFDVPTGYTALSTKGLNL